MPRPKTEADERYNARRRAKRLAARLEREQNNKSAQNVISALRDMISQSYGRASERLSQTITKLEQFTRPLRERSLRRNITERRNAIFRQAQRFKSGSAESKYFWRKTQGIWEGKVTKEERYQAIINYFETNETVSKQYKEWLKKTGREFKSGDIQNIYDYIMSEEGAAEQIQRLRDAGEVPEQYANAIAGVITYG